MKGIDWFASRRGWHDPSAIPLQEQLYPQRSSPSQPRCRAVAAVAVEHLATLKLRSGNRHQLNLGPRPEPSWDHRRSRLLRSTSASRSGRCRCPQRRRHRLVRDVRLLERYEAVCEDRRQGKVCF
jgi:hypothetical protein